ncbi:MAG TPA: hypothetical protein VJ884_00005, partial [Salinibacter sp.]|nr:hypothetical protein [Salinibacter sp.]
MGETITMEKQRAEPYDLRLRFSFPVACTWDSTFDRSAIASTLAAAERRAGRQGFPGSGADRRHRLGSLSFLSRTN